MIPTNTKEKIAAYTKELRLPAIRNNYSAHARQALKDKTGYEEYLLALLADEFESRIKNHYCPINLLDSQLTSISI